jgi:hypothetical protein
MTWKQMTGTSLAVKCWEKCCGHWSWVWTGVSGVRRSSWLELSEYPVGCYGPHLTQALALEASAGAVGENAIVPGVGGWVGPDQHIMGLV